MVGEFKVIIYKYKKKLRTPLYPFAVIKECLFPRFFFVHKKPVGNYVSVGQNSENGAARLIAYSK